MEWERQRTYDFENGKEKGIEETTTKAAIALYQNGVSIDVIAKSLNISLDKIKEILSQNKSDPFWTEENQARLQASLEHAKQGKLTKHEI